MQSNVFTTDNDGNLNLKAPNALYSLIFLFHLYIIRMLFECHLYVLVCTSPVFTLMPLFVYRMCSYAICMLLIGVFAIKHKNVVIVGFGKGHSLIICAFIFYKRYCDILYMCEF